MGLTCPGLAPVWWPRATLTGVNSSIGQKKVLTWRGTGAPPLFSDRAHVHPNLVDHRGGLGVCQAGGRLRKCHQRL